MTTNEIKPEHSFNEVQQTQILNAIHKFLQCSGNGFEPNNMLSTFYTTYLEHYFDHEDSQDTQHATMGMYYGHFSEATMFYRVLSDLCIDIDKAAL